MAGNIIRRLSFDSSAEDHDAQIKVYLRIRPQSETDTISYTINGNLFKLKDTKNSKIKSFQFSHVFSDKTRQGDIYEICVQNLVTDFIGGHNSTIMTYGTSGAGKTYTLLGTVRNPGVVPRVLFNIFKELPMCPEDELLKMNDSLEVERLDDQLIAKELKLKMKLLKLSESKSRRALASYSSMQDLLDQNATSELQPGTTHYTIWVSFAEIYNEFIFDLLDTKPLKIGQDRPKLKLCENQNSVFYIKNLIKIPVRNGEEAYKILKFGQKNLQYASTKINEYSSRSHCIFTLYMIKCEGEMATVSHFNFCDLAGSERIVNTKNTGSRLKESQSINTSLHVLGKCLSAVHQNQSVDKHKQAMVPFRESKLTKLFHQALLGHERLSLLVNVNPKSTYIEETIHTLNFASIAQEIVLHKELCNRKSKARVSGMSSTLCDNSNIIEISDTEISDADSEISTIASDDELHEEINEQRIRISELEYELSRNERKHQIEIEEKQQEVRAELVAYFEKVLEGSTIRYQNIIRDLEKKNAELLKKNAGLEKEVDLLKDEEENDLNRTI